MKDKVLRLVSKKPVYAPLLLAILEWEEENRPNHSMWEVEDLDFAINPGHLGHLVNQGILSKPLDTRQHTHFILADRESVKEVLAEVKLPEDFELEDLFYSSGRVKDAAERFDREPKENAKQVETEGESYRLASSNLDDSERESLDNLRLSAKDVEILRERGISSVEGLAIQDPKDLPFTSQRSERLIENARQRVAFKEIEDISVGEEEVEVSLRNLNPIIERSTISVFNFKSGCSECSVDVDNMGISSKPVEGLEASWENNVKLQATKWKARLQDKKITEKEKLGITLNPEKIKEFAELNGFDGFWQTVFQNIKGNEILKKSISIAMFSPPEAPVHVAVVGPPASAKSQSIENIEEYFTGIQFLGGNVTRAGLVMNYGSGEPGALATADGKLVLADEFDKVRSQDVQHIYELLSSGKCEVHTGKIHETIRSQFTLIAFMNPRNDTFSQHPISDIDLDPTLASRFGLMVNRNKSNSQILL